MFSAGDSYERFMGRWSRALAFPFVQFGGLRDSDSVLDVGSGTRRRITQETWFSSRLQMRSGFGSPIDRSRGRSRS
jgi:hypothetical protein